MLNQGKRGFTKRIYFLLATLVAIGLAACGGRGSEPAGAAPAVIDAPAVDEAPEDILIEAPPPADYTDTPPESEIIEDKPEEIIIVSPPETVVDDEPVAIVDDPPETVVIDDGSEDIIVDNGSAGTISTGAWTPSAGPYPYGAGSLSTDELGASFTFEAQASGNYALYLWWTQFPDRGSAVPVEIYDGETLLDKLFVNQQVNGGRWNRLGTYDFLGPARIVIISQQTPNTSCADAVRLVPVTASGPSVILTSPASHHLQTSPDLTARADARDLEEGWGVRFLLDTGSQAIDDSLPPYEVVFQGVERAEHTVDALVIDGQGREVAGDDAHCRVLQIGIGHSLVTMGDSLTEGYGDDLAADNLSLDGRDNSRGYAPVLNDLLTEALRVPHHLANEGVGGALSRDGRALIGFLLSKHPDAEAYLVQYGTNDSSSKNSVPSGLGLLPYDPGYSDSFKDNLQRIISAIQGAGKEVYLAKIPIVLGLSSTSYPFADPETAARNQLVREYNQVVEELVLANWIAFAPPDLYAYFAGLDPETGDYRYQEEYFDNLHPNGFGYRSMATLWAETIAGVPAP